MGSKGGVMYLHNVFMSGLSRNHYGDLGSSRTYNLRHLDLKTFRGLELTRKGRFVREWLSLTNLPPSTALPRSKLMESLSQKTSSDERRRS